MGFHRPDDVLVAPTQHALQHRRYGPDHDTDHDAHRHAPTVEAQEAYGNLAMGEQSKAANHEHPVQDAHVPQEGLAHPLPSALSADGPEQQLHACPPGIFV